MSEMPDWLDYDAEHNILTIDGIRYDRKLFQYLGAAKIDHGKAFQIIKREDGVIGLTIINLNQYATVIGRVAPQERHGYEGADQDND